MFLQRCRFEPSIIQSHLLWAGKLKTSNLSRGSISAYGFRTFSSLMNPVYRLYFFGMLGQFASMNMQTVTSALLIYRLTGSPALLGTLSLAQAIPMLIISLFGGAIADRVQKKHVLIIGLICSAGVSLGIAMALIMGSLSKGNTGSYWILMTATLLQGSIMGFMLPARQAIIPEIVSREHLMNAVALNMMGMNVFRLAAPAAAGFIIAAFDFKAIYLTMTGLYLYGAVFMLFVPRTSKVTSGVGNLVADIRNGFNYVKSDLTILAILAFSLVAVVLSMPYQQLLPIFVDDILKVGEIGLGWLMSVSGAGALVGSLGVAALPNKKRGLLLLISSLVSGVALVSFAFSVSWTLSLVFIVFVGLGQSLRATMSSALLQSYTQASYMGRVMSIFMMEFGIVSLVTFVAGLMAEVMPVQWVVSSLALLLIVLTILTLVFVKRVRKLD